MRKMPGQASNKYQVARKDTLQYTPHWYELWPICPPLIKGPFYVCELLFIQTKAYHLLAIYLVWTLQRKMLLLLCNYSDFLTLFDNWLCNRAVESSIQVKSVGLSQGQARGYGRITHSLPLPTWGHDSPWAPIARGCHMKDMDIIFP